MKAFKKALFWIMYASVIVFSLWVFDVFEGTSFKDYDYEYVTQQKDTVMENRTTRILIPMSELENNEAEIDKVVFYSFPEFKGDKKLPEKRHVVISSYDSIYTFVICTIFVLVFFVLGVATVMNEIILIFKTRFMKPEEEELSEDDIKLAAEQKKLKDRKTPK